MLSQILYEDNHLIVVNKQPSEIVQGDKTGDETLLQRVKDYLKHKYNKKGNVFLGVSHRLDRPTSGVLIFARTSKALSRMNYLFKERLVKKTYLAVVKNKPPDTEAKLIHYLIKNEKQNKSYAYITPKKFSKEAILSYKVIGKSIGGYYLLEVALETGRHHQIRSQLASIGCPIKGDLKYGFQRSNKDASVCLHAYMVSFEHPVKKVPLEITARPPKGDVWPHFHMPGII